PGSVRHVRAFLSRSPVLVSWFSLLRFCLLFSPFFFNGTPTTEIYTLSLHDALPICSCSARTWPRDRLRSPQSSAARRRARRPDADRKSTRLNSSHSQISYAVFCLK